jgi:hypothetical protein
MNVVKFILVIHEKDTTKEMRVDEEKRGQRNE